VDVLSSDVERSRAFYGELFGWTSEEQNPQFGGYFNFLKDGARVAGGMPSNPSMNVSDAWSVYLASDDARKTVDAALADGAQVIVGPMEVADLGTMAVVTDPGAAAIGLWQPGTFPGFGVFGEPGTPAWFELHTRDYEAAVAFYRNVFRWDTHVVSETPGFRYTTLSDGDLWLAGIMDASGSLPDGAPSCWRVYFGVADADAALAKAVELGGTVVQPAEDTPYGRMGTVADPNGAEFKLLQR
jgi:predicted enzyme related to lactoylglutathione lyase